MVTVHASVAHIKRFNDQATRAHRRPRRDIAVVEARAS